jgi:hypothetical protein
MNQAVMMSILRSILIAAGGFAVTKGYIDNDTLQQVVSAIVVLAAAAWGAVDKMGKK